jgi:hypothetical protein
MENLAYYLPLLACPLMIGVLFFFMRGIMKGDNKSNESTESQVQLQKNMNDLMEQNKRLMKDLEEMKKAR